MLGIQGLSGEEGRQLERRHNRELAQANRKTTADMKSDRLDRFQEGLRSGNAELEPNLAAARRYQSVRDMKDLFGNHIIRRTITSKLADGTLISVLPPKHVHSLPLKLSEAEMKIVNDALVESTEESKKKKKSNFDFSLKVSFSLRMGVAATHTDDVTRISCRRVACRWVTRIG